MKKLILFMWILGFSISSCMNDVVETDYSSFKIVSSSDKIEPFEPMQLKLQVDDKTNLYYYYDSIVWIANGVADGFYNLNMPDNYNFKTSLNISDYNIGIHRVIAKGYTNGISHNEAAFEYEVKFPTGDFLCLDWRASSVNEYFAFRTGVTPANYPSTGGIGGTELCLRRFTEGKETEFILLEYVKWAFYGGNLPNGQSETDTERIVREQAEIKYTRQLFHDYITELYGESKFHYKGEDVRNTDLWTEYEKRFSNPLEAVTPLLYTDVHPVEIWETPNSYICLFSVYNNWYYIVAEER